ncbi:MAG: DUF4224 domain-containing protein [Acidiferrobacteraceae bacterium]
MLLTTDELQELTGRKRWNAQLKWLQTHGYRHDVTAAGRPVVLRQEMERHLLGTSKQRVAEPRLDLIRENR